MIATSQPAVSIVIPIYNGMPFIIETIESVRKQTYSNWNLILCDNASKDNTVQTLKNYLTKNPDQRIRLIEEQDHLSMGQNWNRSLAYAEGDFIKLLPSDDILLPGCIETQVRLLQEYSDVGFVSSAKEIIDAAGKTYLKRKPLKEGKYSWATLGRKLILAVVNLIGEPGGILFRRELWVNSGLFDPQYRYFIDLEIYLRFLKKTNLYITGTPLYQFRTHVNSESASSRRIAVEEYMRLLEAYNTELNLAQKPLLKTYLGRKAYFVSWARSMVMKTRNAMLKAGV